MAKKSTSDKLRQRIYNTIQPGTYNTDTKDLINRLSNFISNKNRFDTDKIKKEYSDLSIKLQDADKNNDSKKVRELLDKIDKIGNRNTNSIDDPYSEDGWSKYLGLPQKNNTFTESTYKPSKSSDPNATYFKMPKEFEDELLNIYKTQPMPKDSILNEYPYFDNTFGENKTRARVLGNFKVGVGTENGKKYLSYYDKYDLSPNLPIIGNTSIDFIGNPYEIYGRMPLDKEVKIKNDLNQIDSTGNSNDMNTEYKSGGRLKNAVNPGKIVRDDSGKPILDKNGNYVYSPQSGRAEQTMAPWEYLMALPENAVGDAIFGAASKVASPLIKKLTGKGLSKIASKVSNTTDKIPFVSDINWGKWNKEIPNNPSLLKEYHAIEESAKKSGNWMKNPDGSEFIGTPEQFVQQNSSNFKNAFSDGNGITYRGDYKHYPELDYNPIFTGDKETALNYTSGNASYWSPFHDSEAIAMAKGKNVGGLHELYYKNNPELKIDAKNRDWAVLNVPEINKTKNVTTDDVQNYIAKYQQDYLGSAGATKLKNAVIDNVYDNSFKPGTVRILPHVEGNYLKSARGNNGMFDMTNPNIYKSLIGGAVANKALNNSNDMNNEYKYGGSIHVNPANKGKFNVLKKRTGKSTEELTHSKNPLTRKRAVFAQNAGQWNYEDGGLLNSNYYNQYVDGGDLDGNEPSWFEQKKNEIMKSVEGMSFTDQLKKLNGLIPMIKMIPGGEKWLKDQAYNIASQSSFSGRDEKDINYAINGGDINDRYTGSDSDNKNRDLIKLALYGDDKAFKSVDDSTRNDAIIPLKDKRLNEKYKDIPAYFIDASTDNKTYTPSDSIPYDRMRETVGELLNRNRGDRGKNLLTEPKLTQAADSVLNSITPDNSVIYSVKGAQVSPPYDIKDDLAGYVSRIRRDPKTNDLHYDVNDVWDFDSGYSDRWGGGAIDKNDVAAQAKALSSVAKPFYMVGSNPVAHKKSTTLNEDNNLETMKKYKGGYLKFLGGDIDPTGAKGINDSVTGTASGLANMTFNPSGAELRPSAASGALKGIEAGKDFGLAGTLIGGGIGAITGINEGHRADFSDQNNIIKQRNQMLGIKANGGYIVPMGVNSNQSNMYDDGGLLTEFNTGGSHESNPNGGIQQGFAPDGNPNKVEQGETKHNDYIFSDRLKIDEQSVSEYNLPKSMIGKTFAEASKIINKSHKERPHDPISRDTVKANLSKLMSANDEIREYENSSMMAMGGHMYDGGSTLNLNRPREEVSLGQSSEILSKPFVPGLFFDQIKDKDQLSKTGTSLFPGTSGNGSIKDKNDLSFLKDPKNIRYAPIAFDALAGAGLFGRSPKPDLYSPTFIQSNGRLNPLQVDEQSMRAGIDSAYQNQIRGLADISGGSSAALRSGLTGLSDNYMSAVGQGFLGANTANNQSKMQADQYNLSSDNNIASANAQFANQGNMYNNQLINQNKALNYDNRMSYLGKASEGLGDVGYEARNAEILPRLFGYDQYGNYRPLGDNAKASGGRLRMIRRKK